MNLLNNKSKYLSIFLLTISGLMLGFSFPPFKTGVFAVFAFVPLFLVLSDIDSYGKAFRNSYFAFFIFNLIAISWVGGFGEHKDIYLMVAGVFLLVVHPAFLSIPIIVFTFIRRNYNFKLAVYSFPFLWVSFEFLHSLTELAFPWLTLGNTMSYDLSLIQYASYTGVYGVSFWILLINILVLILLAKILLKEWTVSSKQSLSIVALLLVIYLLPKFYGTIVLNEKSNHENKKIKIALIQPNIDPWEKWEYNAQQSQLEKYQSMTAAIPCDVDLVIWPETATPYYVLMPQYQFYFEKIKRQVDSLNIALFTGIPDIYIYKTNEKVPPSAKQFRASGEYYDSYNSSMLLIPLSNEIQKYAKIRLVPFSERVPYADALHFLRFPQWGVGIGGWGIGKDTTVFTLPLEDSTRVKFSNLICYESIYPTFVANFVRKGAEFLIIITNDSWWDDSFGPYQHQRYAIFRAIENRRWIARCANGGISCFIDPYGNILDETKMYATTTMTNSIQTRNYLTFYSKYGDVFATSCLFISGFIVIAVFGKKIYAKVRSTQ
jgi:apolipoprotein N-acyltransferase